MATPYPLYLPAKRNIILWLDFKAAHIYASNKVKLRGKYSSFIPLFWLSKKPYIRKWLFYLSEIIRETPTNVVLTPTNTTLSEKRNKYN